uniref:Prosaposin n=1 Tax=Coturnix japonica TaxID=93934 RepID=A0A8C2Y891_COTJA
MAATLGIHMCAWVLMFSSPPPAGASPLPECGEQPEEWCRDVGTAAKCGVLELCRLTVWDQKGVPCHLCQVVVSMMGKILQDNSTEEKLRVFLDKRCQYLPFQDWSVKCKKMVDTGVLILAQLDPKVVCGTIKLCQRQGGREGALKFQEQPPAPADPAQDLAQLAVPFINGIPLLLQPQDLPHTQDTGDLCEDCARLVAAVQLELSNGATTARSLVARAKEECEDTALTLLLCEDGHSLQKDANPALQGWDVGFPTFRAAWAGIPSPGHGMQHGVTFNLLVGEPCWNIYL